MSTDAIAKVAVVAKSDEQQSALALKRSQENHRQQQAQLEQLQSYKAEYERKLEALCNQGIEARQMQDYRAFLVKLDQAIRQQQGVAREAEVALGKVKNQWQANYSRSNALENLIENREQELRQQRDKAEQKEADDRYLSQPRQS